MDAPKLHNKIHVRSIEISPEVLMMFVTQSPQPFTFSCTSGVPEGTKIVGVGLTPTNNFILLVEHPSFDPIDEWVDWAPSRAVKLPPLINVVVHSWRTKK